MKNSVMLTITFLLTILLFSFHLADDIVRGFEPGSVKTFNGAIIMVVLLCALLFADRRLGLIVILLGSILAAGVPIIHMRGAGLVGGRNANHYNLFWVWTLLAMAVTGMFSAILAARGLWTSRSKISAADER